MRSCNSAFCSPTQIYSACLAVSPHFGNTDAMGHLRRASHKEVRGFGNLKETGINKKFFFFFFFFFYQSTQPYTYLIIHKFIHISMKCYLSAKLCHLMSNSKMFNWSVPSLLGDIHWIECDAHHMRPWNLITCFSKARK